MPPAATEARFPHVPEGRGHYESFYLRAVDPGQPRGAWIRYTVHKRPGQPPRGSLWFTLFDANADGPVASKVTLGPHELSAGDGSLVRIGDSVFQPGRVTGSAKTEQADASWQLAFEGAPPHGAPRCMRAPTAATSCFPAARRRSAATWPGRPRTSWVGSTRTRTEASTTP